MLYFTRNILCIKKMIHLANFAKKPLTVDNFELFLNNLKILYKTKLLPLEKRYDYHYFHSPYLEDGDFTVKPMIMLVGQYSTGKTTLIKYLLKTEFPGMRIGPEPTTDKFHFVSHGTSNRIIPGNALVVDPRKQFRTLSQYGNSFLNKLQCSECKTEVLKNLSVVDTPGILSGEKQRVDRGYDFVGVLKWFAERADRILLLFDAHKLDISDEFRWCIEALRGHDEKIEIILNKADMVDEKALMRVYGALMWSLGKIFNSPEVVRIYVGSFWDEPLRCNAFQKLFETEQQDLLHDIMSLPKNSAIRKLNDFIKRARLSKVHAYIIGTLHREMPYVFGKDTKKKHLIASLSDIYSEIQLKYNISSGDLPQCSKMQLKLENYDFSKLNGINTKMIRIVDEMMENDISELMGLISDNVINSEVDVSGGMFDLLKNNEGLPFDFLHGEGINAGLGENDWIVTKHRRKYNDLFNKYKADNGKIHASTAKVIMNESKLPRSVLLQIWKLSDIDNDNSLDSDEFALAMYLIDIKNNGHDIPKELPNHLIPPSKKTFESVIEQN